MVGLRALFGQIFRVVEEAAARQSGADPGTGSGHDARDDREQPQPDAVWEPRQEPPRPWRSNTTQSPWSRGPSENPAPASATRRAPGRHGEQPTDRSPWDMAGSRTIPCAHALLARIRARLDTPDALREAFVIKEILDRPLARRRARQPGDSARPRPPLAPGA